MTGFAWSRRSGARTSLVARQTKPDGCGFDDGFFGQASDGRNSARLDAFSQLRRCSSVMNLGLEEFIEDRGVEFVLGGEIG